MKKYPADELLPPGEEHFESDYVFDLDLIKLQEIVDKAKTVVFFGGAGVSVASGIPDFRSDDGLYNTATLFPHDPEDILSHDFFFSETEEFYRFYKAHMLPLEAKPNAAHHTLARLEKAGKLSAVITQNIDALHTKAGSKTVFELHGSIERNFCLECGKAYSAETIKSAKGVPRCSCGGLIKPDVVLYGEALDTQVLSGALEAIHKADVLIVGGTSLKVQPAASLLRHFMGSHLVIINRTPTAFDVHADLLIRRPIEDSLGSLFVPLPKEAPL